MGIKETDQPPFSIIGWCGTYNVSPPRLYELWKRDCGPKFIRVGNRRLITEDAATWRRRIHQREAGELAA
jgi:hypothetical protein